MSERAAHHAALAARIDQRTAVVAVIGLGYVGLPLLHAVASAGFPVIGLDHDATKIERLRRAENYLPHLGPGLADDLAANPRVTLSSDPAILANADAVLLCVPTPLDAHSHPDLSAVQRAAHEVREHALVRDPAHPRLIVLESTTYPGTTREIVAPILEGQVMGHAAVRAPTPVFTAFSPEREDPGNKHYSTRTIPKLVGGIDPESADLAARLYRAVVTTVVPVSSAEVAEAAKVVENVYRAVNIALVNELKIALDAMGLDIWEVLDAAATKPFGFHRFNPGPGFGGHCVPVDPFYLSWKARQVGAPADFIELAGLVNRRMPEFIIERCRTALAATRRTLASAHVLVLGLAYKPDIADVRESPSFELIALLKDAGAEVSYHDPYVAQTRAGRRHDLQMTSVPWTPESLAAADLVLIATDHTWYDWGFIARHAPLIIDTRNAMARAGFGPGTAPNRATIFKA